MCGQAVRRRPPVSPTVNYYFRLRDSTEPVEMTVIRGTVPRTVKVNAVEEKSEFDSLSAMADPQKNLVAELGILGVDIDQRIAAAATGLRDPNGVIVVARAAGGSTDVPLVAKDVIRRVNNQ